MPSYLNVRTDNGVYQFVRRVPAEHASDRLQIIRKSLGTRDRKSAAAAAKSISAALDAQWARPAPYRIDKRRPWAEFETARARAEAAGLTYLSADVLAKGDAGELLKRIAIATEHIDDAAFVAAVLGGADRPAIRISDLWTHYEEHKSAALDAYSVRQFVKHKASRVRALAYLMEVLGDMPIADISRDHVLRFRDWWSAKMLREGLTSEAPNRCFSDIKGMLSAIDDRFHTDHGAHWRSLRMKPTAASRTKGRATFANDFIQDQLLAPGALDCLRSDARLIFYVLIETGLRPSEACNLREVDIRLDAETPHIVIENREDRVQKTATSVRQIPLVGVALWAMRQAPAGFPRFRDRADSFSAIVNRELKTAGLRPTPQHTVYSIRHAFQDRVLAAKAPDRLQADLMGHAFERPKYGEGSTMRQKLELLDAIKFDWPAI